MTRQHFKALAEALSNISNLESRRQAARAVAQVCRRFNSGFKADRFFAACGLED